MRNAQAGRALAVYEPQPPRREAPPADVVAGGSGDDRSTHNLGDGCSWRRPPDVAGG